MSPNLIKLIQQINPWLTDATQPILRADAYIPRIQVDALLSPDWDSLCTVITGPRQAGKTTLGLHIADAILKLQRFTSFLYLNCDYAEIRSSMTEPLFLNNLREYFNLIKPIIFIDEGQRLQNPGLTLKIIIDLKLPLKLIVTGSSQLEIKSKAQEYLTGRQLEVTVLPLSWQELTQHFAQNDRWQNQVLLCGC